MTMVSFNLLYCQWLFLLNDNVCSTFIFFQGRSSLESLMDPVLPPIKVVFMKTLFHLNFY